MSLAKTIKFAFRCRPSFPALAHRSVISGILTTGVWWGGGHGGLNCDHLRQQVFTMAAMVILQQTVAGSLQGFRRLSDGLFSGFKSSPSSSCRQRSSRFLRIPRPVHSSPRWAPGLTTSTFFFSAERTCLLRRSLLDCMLPASFGSQQQCRDPFSSSYIQRILSRHRHYCLALLPRFCPFVRRLLSHHVSRMQSSCSCCNQLLSPALQREKNSSSDVKKKKGGRIWHFNSPEAFVTSIQQYFQQTLIASNWWHVLLMLLPMVEHCYSENEIFVFLSWHVYLFTFLPYQEWWASTNGVWSQLQCGSSPLWRSCSCVPFKLLLWREFSLWIPTGRYGDLTNKINGWLCSEQGIGIEALQVQYYMTHFTFVCNIHSCAHQ